MARLQSGLCQHNHAVTPRPLRCVCRLAETNTSDEGLKPLPEPQGDQRRVLVSDRLAESGLNILREQPDLQIDVNTGLTEAELLAAIPNYHALLVRSRTQVTAEVIDAGSNLIVVGRAGVGTDNIDLNAATRRGIIVMNCPAGNTIAAAEHTVTMMMAISRNVASANASMRSGTWDRTSFVGYELYGKTLGVIGLGRVGSEVVRRARAFGMTPIGLDPYISTAAAERLGVEIVSLEEVLARADYLSLHMPLTRESYHSIGAAQLAKMKPGAFLINCARGGIIDEGALYEALTDGKIRGAALDVFEEEPPNDWRLIDLPNVLATPHLGGSTQEAQDNVSIEIASQTVRALRGHAVTNAVNLPPVEPGTVDTLGPYIALAERLASLQAQMMGSGTIEEVSIEYAGPIFEGHFAPVTVAVQKGILSPVLSEVVNYVNAPFLFSERGIRLSETRRSTHGMFSNLLTVIVRTNGRSRLVSGTVFGVQPRVVMIDSYHCAATPDGPLLLIFNDDEPGTIGIVGTILGRAGVNIADMGVGRVQQGGSALMLVNVDSVVPREVIQELQAQRGVNSVHYVVLPQ